MTTMGLTLDVDSARICTALPSGVDG